MCKYSDVGYPDAPIKRSNMVLHSWNTLITFILKSGQLAQALNVYHQMPKNDSTNMSRNTYVDLLKACKQLQDVEQCLLIHVDVARIGLVDFETFIGNILIDIYGKLGLLEKAQQVFVKLRKKDVFSWTSLIAAFLENGHSESALDAFEAMKQEDISPNAVTCMCALKACASIGAINKGRQIHHESERHGFIGSNWLLGSSLVDMYAKCGAIKIAAQVLDKLPVRDVVSWTAILTGCVDHNYTVQAFNFFQHMQLEGVSPNVTTLLPILRACSSTGAISMGNELHAIIKKEKLLKRPCVGNTLIDMYVKFGSLTSAQEVFDSMPFQDVISWTTLIAGYVEDGQEEKAIQCWDQMERDSICPNVITLVYCSKACGLVKVMDNCLNLHSEIEKRGLLKEAVVLGNALVDMYAKCGSLICAQRVFERLQVRDIFSWNSLITAYTEIGCGRETLDLYEKMQYEGVLPDVITFIYCLKSCGFIGAIDIGHEINTNVERQGLMDREPVIGHILIEMYAGYGLLAVAQQVFNNLSCRNVVSWNVLMAGYVEHGCGQVALACFKAMQSEGISPNLMTYICSLKACASLASTDCGNVLHSIFERQGLFENDIAVGNSLIAMYARFGLLEKAQYVFDKLPVQDEISWNALIRGYTKHGHSAQALTCFEQRHLKGSLL